MENSEIKLINILIDKTNQIKVIYFDFEIFNQQIDTK